MFPSEPDNRIINRTAQDIYDKRPNTFYYKGELFRIRTKIFWENDRGDIIAFGTGRIYLIKHDCPAREDILNVLRERYRRR